MQFFSPTLAVLAAALFVARGGADFNDGCGVVTVTKLMSSSPSSIGSDSAGSSTVNLSSDEIFKTQDTASDSPSSSLLGATVFTVTVGTQVIEETFIPTTYTQLKSVTDILTTMVINPQGSTVTVAAGPFGVGWEPFDQPTNAPALSPPSALPSALPSDASEFQTDGHPISSSQRLGASSQPLGASSQLSGVSGQPVGATSQATESAQPRVIVQSEASSHPQGSGKLRGSSQSGASNEIDASSQNQQTVLADTVGSQTVTGTFIPTTIASIASLTSITTSILTNAQSSVETLVVGPSGVAWKPLSQVPSGIPQLAPPTVPPDNEYTTPLTQPGSSPKVSSASKTEQKSSAIITAVTQPSVSGAFDDPKQSETTVIAGGATLHYSKETIASLSNVETPTTITTPIVETNKDGDTFTIPAAHIIIGPGGTWWHGGSGGFGIDGPSCIWPFCPPGGGGDIGGSGSGGDPKDPNSPGSKEKPSDPDDDDDSKSLKSEATSKSYKSEATSNSEHSEIRSTLQKSGSTSNPLTIKKTGTTLSSSSSSSPASSTSISACCKDCSGNIKTSKLKMPKRGLSHGTLKPQGHNLDKRILRTPAADYGGNVDSFITVESIFADALEIKGENGGIPTGFSESLATRRVYKTVRGLFGCTSVVVASQAGVWMSHFWEVPSFRANDKRVGKPRGPQEIRNFRSQVLDPMQKGDVDIPGLTQYTTNGGQFSQAQKPVWAIITPRSRGGAPGNLRYQPEVNEIQDTLQNLLPGAPPVIVDYEPNYSQDAQDGTSAGKVFFQYDPYGTLVPDPQDPCKLYQQATFRLWADVSPDPILSKDWAAEGNQLITDWPTYFSNHPHRKRDNAPACSLPSISLQASTESGSQPNMSPSSAPDPDFTFFATLSPASSTSPPSSSTPPPPTTSAPPPITSPPPAPSGGVSCGSGSPNWSPESVSHLMVNFCQGNADYDPGAPAVDSAQPIADLSDIPDDQKELPVLNNLYATLITARPNCATVTFGFSASSSLCQAYIASITASCTQGGGVLTSAGCFDFGVKAYTAGRGHAQW